MPYVNNRIPNVNDKSRDRILHDGYVRIVDIIPFLDENIYSFMPKNVDYWYPEYIAQALNYMPPVLMHIGRGYIKKSEIIPYLRKCVITWNRENISKFIDCYY